MSGDRISDMTARAALAAGDMAPIISGGQNYKIDLYSEITKRGLYVGLFSSISTLTIPAGVNRITTSGATVENIGSATFINDDTVTLTDVANYPHLCAISANSRGWRIDPHAPFVDFDVFGAQPDDTTDCYPAFQEMIAYGIAHAFSPVGQVFALDFVYSAPWPVRFTGRYYSSQTWSLYLSWELFSLRAGNGIPGAGHPIRVRWPANMHGIVINNDRTAIDQVAGADTYRSAAGTSITGLTLHSAGGADRTKHGIWMRAAARIVGNAIDGFPGDNIHAVGSLGNTGTGTNITYGSVNSSEISGNVFSNSGRHAFYTEQSDANAMTVHSNNVLSAGAGGFIDSSFLGNIYPACKVHGYAANGQGRVAYGGNLYDLIDPTAGIGAATTPGTDSTVWYSRGTTGLADSWSNVGVYYPCCPILIFGASNRSVVINPYIEGGTGAISHCGKPGLVINSNADPGSQNFTTFSAVQATNNDTGVVGYTLGVGSFRKWADGTVHEASVGGGEDTVIIKSSLGGWRMINDGTGNITMSWAAVGASQTWQYSLSPLLGRSTPVSYAHVFSNFALGANTTAARKIDMLSAAPTSGSYAQGEFIFNSTPAAGGKLGWSCTTGGIIATVAWSATHAYNVGDLATNDTGKSYICITAGTSAGSGGPTGTGSNITDGTVHWKYGTAFVFKACGVIDA